MQKNKIIISLSVASVMIGLILGLGVIVFAESSFGRAENSASSQYAQDKIIVKFKEDKEPFRVVAVQAGTVAEKIKEYKARQDVVYAEPDYYMYALGSNDTAYTNQWSLNNISQTIYRGSGNPASPMDTSKPIGSGAAGSDMDWDEAWFAFSGASWSPVVIAVVDSGIDETHPDLKTKLWTNEDEIPGNRKDDDNNGFVDDTWGWNFARKNNKPHDKYGHGTHVSGIAAGAANNNAGIAGVAFPDAVSIMAVKALSDSGIGSTSDVAKSIRYSADNGAKVINLSLGGGNSQTLKDAVDYAWGKGVLLAAAAGNDGNTNKHYPASYSNVISVAATDYNDAIASFSNYNSEVDVAGPGVNVFSAFPSYKFYIGTVYGRARYYDVGSGTSMAAPQVTGLAGLLFSQDLSRTNATVRDIIERTADDKGAGGRDDYYGFGRINVFDALAGNYKR